MQILKAGALYFAFVFGAGFMLGTIRVLWLVPNVGVRTAELMETPIMLVVIIVAARWIGRRLAVPPAPVTLLGVGLVALGLLLVAELGLVLGLQGLTIAEYVESRDPVAGTVYIVMLGVFAVMPIFLLRRS
jgi:hypothetical protein